MTILIDPPAWPAHGTLFSHLISDTSLTELHTFARTNHLSQRAFDLDHYDVPAELYTHLINAGAQPVTGNELTRALIRSGLRVPLKERPPKIRGRLLIRWNKLLPGNTDLGEHLLDHWEEPHRSYHNSAHLLEMLETLDALYTPQQPSRAVLLAAWLHDIIYEAEPGKDEAASADFARDVLTPLVKKGTLTLWEVNSACALITATTTHLPAEIDGLERYDLLHFLDADLAIFAADSARYSRYVAGVRREYSAYSDEEFAQGRVAILKNFVAREYIFATEKAREKYEKRARLNIENELSSYC